MKQHDIKCVIAMGKVGNIQLNNGAAAITKLRGSFKYNSEVAGNTPILPVFGPAHVLTRPENKELFETDLAQLAYLRREGWNLEEFKNAEHGQHTYEWCLDLQFMLDDPPVKVAVDTETLGKDWHMEGFRCLTVSITTEEGNAYVVPVDAEYWNDDDMRDKSTRGMKKLTVGQIDALREQLRQVLANPYTSVVGHNFSYDLHVFRTMDIPVAQWYADTMQLAFAVDENMLNKSLTDCTRRWVPALAGYSDGFDSITDKSRMDRVLHCDMLEYAGGDTDATFRLAEVLIPKAKEDTRNWKTFTHVQMPTLRAFVEMEKNGVQIDKKKLRELQADLTIREKEAYASLIARVPAPVLRRHVDAGHSFGRADFIRDVLFSPDGMGLTPLVYTKTTKKLEPHLRIASTSAKDHLPFFDSNPFVQDLIAYKKLEKMRSTYVGLESHEEVKLVKRTKTGLLPKWLRDRLTEEGIPFQDRVLVKRKRARRGVPELSTNKKSAPKRDIFLPNGRQVRLDDIGNYFTVNKVAPTGFWQYLNGTDYIHPSFYLHGTVTGRSASRNPNAQNFPKRGEMAKMFRSIFVAPRRHVLLEADLSQAELRVAAWMANEPEMIRIYQNNGDIHSATAAAVMNISEEKFNAAKEDLTPFLDVRGQWGGAQEFLSKFNREAQTKLTLADFIDYKRFQAKAVNFGLIYGLSWRGLKIYARLDYGIEWTDREAQSIRDAYFRKYRGLEAWHEGMERFVRNKGYVRSLHGAIRRIPSVDSDERGVQSGAIRQAINSPVQRFGSDLGLIALHRMVRDSPNIIKPRLFIHDANVMSTPRRKAMETASHMKFYMESSPLKEWFGIEPPFPILSDVGMGPDLGSMKDLKDVEAVQPEWYRSGENAPTEALMETWEVLKEREVIMVDA